MHKYFPICEEDVIHIRLCNCSILNFLINEENMIFFFISVEINYINSYISFDKNWSTNSERIDLRQADLTGENQV
jgi:hypothetical protein